MSDSLLARVSAALEGIPHEASCPTIHTYSGAFHPCDCSRERVIAQRVTEAIKAACEGTARCCESDGEEDAVLALLAPQDTKENG